MIAILVNTLSMGIEYHEQVRKSSAVQDSGQHTQAPPPPTCFQTSSGYFASILHTLMQWNECDFSVTPSCSPQWYVRPLFKSVCLKIWLVVSVFLVKRCISWHQNVIVWVLFFFLSIYYSIVSSVRWCIMNYTDQTFHLKAKYLLYCFWCGFWRSCKCANVMRSFSAVSHDSSRMKSDTWWCLYTPV